jgi:tetratricopeptide (TPR) repeat protein
MTDYERLLTDILDRSPSSETLALVLQELKRLGRPRKVIQECIRALQSHPDDLSLRLILAEAYFEEGLVSQAEAEIETATTRMDRYASAYRLQAEIYRSQKRNDGAIRSLKIYLALRPHDEGASALLKELEPAESPPPAEALPAGEETVEPVPVQAAEAPVLKRVEPLEEEEPESRLEEDALSEIATPTLAEVYVHQGQIQEAIRIYERVIAQNPDDRPSMTRVEELRAMAADEPPLPEQTVPKATQKKQKTIAVLESWLANIRKMSEDTLSA